MIQHNLEGGSESEILVNISIQWETYMTNKLEERDFRILLQKEKFEKLKDISFVGMQWLDNPLEMEYPEYAIYLGPNNHWFREIGGQWGREAYILKKGYQYEFSHPSEQELLMEFLEEFGMDKLFTALKEKRSQKKGL